MAFDQLESTGRERPTVKRTIAACIAAVAVSASGAVFETDDGFSITLPDGWVQIPGTVIANYSDRINDEEETNGVAQAYDYGYQMNGSAGWLSYPCILVQVNASARFPTGSMVRYLETAEGVEASLSEDKTLLMGVREQNGIKCLFARQLTEYGFIELTGFAPADSFDDHVDVFKQVFSSLSIDESIGYQPRLTDNAPVIGGINMGKVLVVCIQGALVGGALAFVYILIRRKLKRA
jgi:hypothetical protein